MKKDKFYIVYLEDSKTGNRISDVDIINHHLTWTFYDEDSASDFAALLVRYLNGRYIPCVAECCSGDECRSYQVFVP